MKDTVKTAPKAVFPQDLPDILSHFPRVKILSLDCFDTLLWRSCAAPTDVFHDLEAAPAFRGHRLNAALRIRAESTARSLMRTRAGMSEVGLPHIYRAAFPDLTDAEVTELAHAEIEAEIRACYGFPNTLELIRAARNRGLKVAVVSDTYLSQRELRRLLAATLPPDVTSAIDIVFCSSDFGRSKSDGLFRTVLDRLHVRPEEVLHVGDNEAADLDAPLRLGMHAAHLDHHAGSIRQSVRLEAAATTMLYPAARQTRSLPAVYRGSVAQSQPTDASELLGRIGAGPLLHAFARFAKHRAEALQHSGRMPKLLFLMRDGYLPMLAFRALLGENHPLLDNVHAVEISRFASYAASFRSEEDVDHYLARMAGPAIDKLAKQLLLPDALAKKLLARASASKHPFEEFSRLIHRPDTMATVFTQSRDYRSRLRRYLERVVNLSEGDTLLFIDLGYAGTAQTCLEPLFREEWGVDVHGCYLLLSRTPGWEKSRAGLIAPDLVDDNAIASLVAYVAALEQICTADHGSVVDYDADGLAIRKSTDIAPEQYRRIQPVQAACQRFVVDAEQFFLESGQSPSVEDLRVNAVGLLGRLLFFPTVEEMDTLRGFALDVNLNSEATIPLFNTEQAEASLRRLGLAYTLVDDRMNQHMELRYFGLDLVTTIVAQQRFAWNLSIDDLSHRRLRLPIILSKADTVSVNSAEARPTYEGFYAATVPIGAGEFEFAIQFGALLTWLQLDSVTLLPIGDLYRKRNIFDRSRAPEIDLNADLVLDKIQVFDNGLLHCSAESAFVFVPTHGRCPNTGHHVCRVVFRPIAYRVLT
jgi:FMN phosphatase YigB (HAD superfamily)